MSGKRVTGSLDRHSRRAGASRDSGAGDQPGSFDSNDGRNNDRCRSRYYGKNECDGSVPWGLGAVSRCGEIHRVREDSSRSGTNQCVDLGTTVIVST
jgi:hypothetical protein